MTKYIAVNKAALKKVNLDKYALSNVICSFVTV